MAQKRKFDSVQILGVALAVLLLIGGNYYLRVKYERERIAWEQAQAELQRQQALQQPPQIESAVPPAPSGGNGQTPPPPAPDNPPAPEAAAEPADAGDITVSTKELKLVFTARGASLRQALLSQAYVDAGTKRKAGLEVLGEIEAGKLALSMPRFEIGAPEPEKKQERLVFDALDGPQKALSRRLWKLESNSGAFDPQGHQWVIRYSVTLAQGFTLTKTFTIHQARSYIELETSVTNNSGAPVTFSYSLYGAPGVLLDGPPDDPKGGGYVSISAALAGRDAAAGAEQAASPDVTYVWPDTAAKEQSEKNSVSRAENLWGGVKNRFYMAMLISLDPSQLIRISAVPIANKPQDPDKRLAEPNAGVLGLRKESGKLESGATSGADRYALYIGPNNERHLSEVEAQLNQTLYLPYALQYCDIFYRQWPRVDWIARQMMTAFHGLSRVFGNYGIAVILLTMLVKLCLHPLQRKMMVSMSKLQKLQPELKKLQEKYKNQTNTQAKQRMFQEQQDIMRKGGASYSSGCLPMFVQLPILTAIYGIFNRAFDIRGAEFLWIKDLSQADRLLTLGFWPKELNLLPVVYAALQLGQMKLTPQPKATDPQQEMQQKMMQYMPIVFSIMLYSMPSGLMLYFAASAVFGMLESWYIRKFLIKDTPPPAVLATTQAAKAKG